ncbi:hypothetical protein LB505_009474 [Fusarium chuoi]|nr:hypothetical protein LB505_009474 [Fusarium chuoi]
MDDGPMFDDHLMDDTMEDGADDAEPAEDNFPQEDSEMQEPVETELHNEEPTEEPTENPIEDESFGTELTNEEPAEEETAEEEITKSPWGGCPPRRKLARTVLKSLVTTKLQKQN